MNPPNSNTSFDGESQWKPTRFNEIDPNYLRVIDSILDRFPNLPISVQKITTMVYDTKISAKEISELAITDPVLVSNILKRVNSTFYSLSNKIGNLNHAIMMIGFNEVRNIALQCGLSKAIASVETGDLINIKDLWAHSYCVAVSCEYWAKKLGRKDSGTLMTMGMLHDIGKYALFTIGSHAKGLGTKLKELKDISPNASLLEKEERLFKVNHAIVGSILARKWKLPEQICQVLEYHHYPNAFPFDEIPEHLRKDVAILAIADYGVNIIMVSSFYGIPSEECFRAAGLSSSNDVIPADLKTKVELVLKNLD